MSKIFRLVFCVAVVLAFEAQEFSAPAAAQEIFNGGSQVQGNTQAQGNPDCPPPVINGITPKNWSCKTGTQGVQGNPYCPPPVIVINGRRHRATGPARAGRRPPATRRAGPTDHGIPSIRASRRWRAPRPASRVVPAAITGSTIRKGRGCRRAACGPCAGSSPSGIGSTSPHLPAATSSRQSGRPAAISSPRVARAAT